MQLKFRKKLQTLSDPLKNTKSKGASIQSYEIIDSEEVSLYGTYTRKYLSIKKSLTINGSEVTQPDSTAIFDIRTDLEEHILNTPSLRSFCRSSGTKFEFLCFLVGYKKFYSRDGGDFPTTVLAAILKTSANTISNYLKELCEKELILKTSNKYRAGISSKKYKCNSIDLINIHGLTLESNFKEFKTGRNLLLQKPLRIEAWKTLDKLSQELVDYQVNKAVFHKLFKNRLLASPMLYADDYGLFRRKDCRSYDRLQHIYNGKLSPFLNKNYRYNYSSMQFEFIGRKDAELREYRVYEKNGKLHKHYFKYADFTRVQYESKKYVEYNELLSQSPMVYKFENQSNILAHYVGENAITGFNLIQEFGVLKTLNKSKIKDTIRYKKRGYYYDNIRDKTYQRYKRYVAKAAKYKIVKESKYLPSRIENYKRIKSDINKALFKLVTAYRFFPLDLVKDLQKHAHTIGKISCYHETYHDYVNKSYTNCLPNFNERFYGIEKHKFTKYSFLKYFYMIIRLVNTKKYRFTNYSKIKIEPNIVKACSKTKEYNLTVSTTIKKVVDNFGQKNIKNDKMYPILMKVLYYFGETKFAHRFNTATGYEKILALKDQLLFYNQLVPKNRLHELQKTSWFKQKLLNYQMQYYSIYGNTGDLQFSDEKHLLEIVAEKSKELLPKTLNYIKKACIPELVNPLTLQSKIPCFI
jgi:hypothetical protein